MWRRERLRTQEAAAAPTPSKPSSTLRSSGPKHSNLCLPIWNGAWPGSPLNSTTDKQITDVISPDKRAVILLAKYKIRLFQLFIGLEFVKILSFRLQMWNNWIYIDYNFCKVGWKPFSKQHTAIVFVHLHAMKLIFSWSDTSFISLLGVCFWKNILEFH